MSVEIRMTRDGSHSLYSHSLHENYHSVHGAINESTTVFIKPGLEKSLLSKKELSILEVGMGTGLNVLLTVKKALELACTIRYTTIEPFPVPLDIAGELNYVEQLGNDVRLGELYQKIHASPWEEVVELMPCFSLQKLRTTLDEFDGRGQTYDLIYFDAFSPVTQPQLWEKDTLEKIIAYLNPGGVFMTYSVKGQLRRDLKALGMIVEKLKGPIGKSAITRATKVN